MRSNHEVRAAAAPDLEALVDLVLAARSESSVGPQLCTDDAARLRTQIGVLASTPGGLLRVAVPETGPDAGYPVGLLIGRLIGPTAFTDQVSLHVEALYVAVPHRRRGAGRALLADVLTIAEQAGADDVYASPLPGARGMQRFFARLGFAPAAAHRVAPIATAQRRLGEAEPGSRRHGGRGLEDLIARRRRVREVHGGEGTAAQVLPQTWRASMSMHVSRAVATRPESESTAIS